jgi:ketosteroid isomerase-like protein
MARNNSKTADEVQIRQLIDRWAGAIRDKNIEVAVSHYARDILLYDLAPQGVDTYKEELAEWFATFQGAVGFEVHDRRRRGKCPWNEHSALSVSALSPGRWC